MSVTPADVQRVAALARLDLTPEEETRLVDELGRILHYMEKLNELDTRDVTPTAHAIPVAGRLRADEPAGFAALDELLAQAPDLRDGYFRVPRVIE